MSPLTSEQCSTSNLLLACQEDPDLRCYVCKHPVAGHVWEFADAVAVALAAADTLAGEVAVAVAVAVAVDVAVAAAVPRALAPAVAVAVTSCDATNLPTVLRPAR